MLATESHIQPDEGRLLIPRSVAVFQTLNLLSMGNGPHYAELDPGIMSSQAIGRINTLSIQLATGRITTQNGFTEEQVDGCSYTVIDRSSSELAKVRERLVTPMEELIDRIRQHQREGGYAVELHEIIRDFYFPPLSTEGKRIRRGLRTHQAPGLQKVEHLLRMVDSPLYLIAQPLTDEVLAKHCFFDPITAYRNMKLGLRVGGGGMLDMLRAAGGWTYQDNHQSLGECGINIGIEGRHWYQL